MDKDIITRKELYLNRRQIMQSMGAGLIGGMFMTPFFAYAASKYDTDEKLTPREHVTTYNNFYEFGTGKGDPSVDAAGFKSKPWAIEIAGECDRPGILSYEDLIAPHKPEERIYRLRCVEGWSMVIPWLGIPLAAVLERFSPNSRAKFVAFETLFDPERMPGQKRSVLEWPYREGLRMDEAMHPLTLLATGLYGEPLPPQNGAPLRLVVPWKYGFKSIKSIVRIAFVEKQPETSWNISAPNEYGFYSNVNPQVDHPRWSQATERRLGEFWRRETLMFNGYENEVASLYADMDLKENF